VPEDRVQRRLAAIMAADVVGYSALMERADEATYANFEQFMQKLVEPSLSRNGGRLIKTTGDGALAEFASPLDAVRSAIEIQDGLASGSSGLKLRIGINLGDVIVGKDGDLFGDGINIAVRLEGLADPGGILISGKVLSEVDGKLDATFEHRGERQLKNISKPVRAFALRRMAGAQAVTVIAAAEPPPLPDKPSVAVLPFQNMSGDPEQGYFADGLVDDIITALSRFKGLFVIARNSSFTYKGRVVDIKQVGRELGVRYVLEGGVRKAGSRLRISGQLIDVATGAHLWADRFDGALVDIFDLQDKVAQQVVGAIAPEVDRAEIERAIRSRIGKMDAVTAHYRGLPLIFYPTTPENNEIAARCFEEAITLDPSFAPAYGGAAACIAWRRANNWPGDIAGDNARVLRYAERLKELGTDDASALNAVGFLLFWFALDFDGGIELIERAIRSNPTYAQALHTRGLIRGWQGESDVAVAELELAMRLSPRDPLNYNALLGLALACHNAGRHAEAGSWTDKAIRAFPPAHYVGMIQAILCYVGAGRLDDAQRAMAECLRLCPGSRASTVTAPHFSPKLRAELLKALIKAGMPE
jgi:TolB-like protein/class 3 adenylate cyclase/tetratricopeptide (TPR) repeat protein